jgi:hypothetical protein
LSLFRRALLCASSTGLYCLGSPPYSLHMVRHRLIPISGLPSLWFCRLANRCRARTTLPGLIVTSGWLLAPLLARLTPPLASHSAVFNVQQERYSIARQPATHSENCAGFCHPTCADGSQPAMLTILFSWLAERARRLQVTLRRLAATPSALQRAPSRHQDRAHTYW